MLKKTSVLLALLFTFNFIHAQPDSVRHFVDSALNLMQQKSMFAKNVNWKLVRDSVAQLSVNANNYSETSRALQYAFNMLGDKHGWLVIDDKEYRNASLQPKENRVSKNMADAAAKGAKIYCGVISGQFAYLSMPFFGGQDTTSMNKFAQRLQDSLCTVVGTGTKGVILDLRLNAGGNSFPMIVGVNNLYGKPQKRKDGKGYYADWNIKDNELRLSETFYVRLLRSCGDLSHLPVAVLVGPVTGSSGEFIAIGFSTRPKTILIGEKTAGYTTANQGYLLPGVNNGIVQAESVATDSEGKEYPDGVQPGIQVKGDDFFDHAKDPKILAAKQWLKKMAGK